MKFNIKSDSIHDISGDIIILAVDDKNQIILKSKLSVASNAFLSNIINTNDLKSEVGASLVVHGDKTFKRVMLVRTGSLKLFNAEALIKITNIFSNVISKLNIKKVLLPIEQFFNEHISAHAGTEFIVRELINASYIINSLKTTKAPTVSIQTLLQYEGSAIKEVKLGLTHGSAVAEGANLTKDLGNLPPNICTPTYLATVAKDIAKQYGMKTKIFDKKQIEQLRMGSFLSVAKGSREAPKFITIEHSLGLKKQKPIVLVGKGITFDAGGISIKPSSDMDEMKYDMGGAASVLGVMKTIGALKLPINVVALIPSCENLPDGLALKPGDIVTSMSGQTIEVLNTDAEGRLILCDALTYAERYNPELVIDVATLTGACVIALGHHATAIFSNHDPLADELKAASNVSLDKAWHMPLWEEYQPQLNSNFADMANIGGRPAGSITAACFLARFAKKYHWAHLDIAGTAWKSGKDKGSTGRPVPMISQFLINRSELKK